MYENTETYKPCLYLLLKSLSSLALGSFNDRLVFPQENSARLSTLKVID
jgi:hypothetical protein